MRLLQVNHAEGTFTLTRKLFDGEVPPYAILSHTWGSDDDEVLFEHIKTNHIDRTCGGYAKLELCARLVKRDGLGHFWIDSACIDRNSSAELSEAINSMFNWYQEAQKCYVYLSDISVTMRQSVSWLDDFRGCRW
jgi:hypothetical protein